MKIYDYIVKDAKGEEVSLAEFKGKLLLVVNTATESALSSQYKGLQRLYEEYQLCGLEVLDFPCNQFMGLSPLSEEEKRALKEEKKPEKGKKKPSMSFATSFMLSLKNLVTKKGRTALTAFAGSIGIIGIALIFASLFLL